METHCEDLLKCTQEAAAINAQSIGLTEIANDPIRCDKCPAKERAQQQLAHNLLKLAEIKSGLIF